MLLLLKAGEAHGYELMRRLPDVVPAAEMPFDPSSLYRLLAALEEEGILSSRLEPGDGGGRRVYSLTAAGRERLDTWAMVLAADHERLGRWLARYRGEGQEP